METIDNFYITLPSNVKGHLTLANTTSKWQTPLPSPITLLGGDWEVCVCEVHFPHTFYNLGPRAAEEHTMTFRYPRPKYIPPDDASDSLIEVLRAQYLRKGTHRSTHTRLTHGFYLPQDIVKAMNAKLSLINFKGRFLFDKPTSRMGILLYPHESITTTQEFSTLLGFKKKAYENNKPNKKKLVKANKPIDLEASTSFIYLYSSVVKKMLLGDIYAPLLRVITISSHFGERVHKQFRQLYYHDVAVNTINSIEISLRNDQGEQFQFQYGKSIVTLHFRKKSSALFK